MDLEKVKQLLLNECTEAGLDYKLMKAIISTESSWIPTAKRYEPTTGRYVISADVFAKQNDMPIPVETTQQMTSFGLGQVMGFNIRAMGYGGPLTDLYNPELNVQYLVKFFKKRCDKYKTLEDKIASYNGGSPQYGLDGKLTLKLQQYVNKVMGFYNQL